MSLDDIKWNIGQCVRCHQCKTTPTPRSLEFSPLCPAIEHGQFHTYSGSGKIITSYALAEGRAEYTPEVLDSLTTCSMCGACDTACQFHLGDLVQPMEAIYEMRVKMFADGKTPAEQNELLQNIARTGNVYGRPRSDRTAWAGERHIPDATVDKVDVLLYVGCANAFDQEQWPGLLSVVDALTDADVAFGTLGSQEVHAGALPFELGHRELARTCAVETISMIRASGARLVVVCDTETLSAFRNFYPRLGLGLEPVEVLHVSEYLDRLAADGRWKATAAREEVVAYHDPCRLGRLSERFEPWEGKWTTVLNGLRVSVPPKPHRFGTGGVYDAPRRLLESVPGIMLVEMERNREFAYCCGAGGGGKAAHPEFAEAAALSRLREAAASGAQTLVSGCGTCTRHLSDVAARNGMDIRVADLAGYLAKS